MNRRLGRSETDRMVAGVCAGLGAYLDVDPTLVRIAFLASITFGGAGIVAYAVLWAIVPSASRVDAPGAEVVRENVDEVRRAAGEAVRSVREAFAQARGRRSDEPPPPPPPT